MSQKRVSLAKWTPKQQTACDTARDHRFTLFGGARGPGKSYWLRWYCIVALLDWHDQGKTGVRAMLACEDYPALRDRQIEKIQREFPAWMGEYAISASEFRLVPDLGSGVICLRNLDDPSKYQSSEYAMIAIDELTQTKQSTWDMLRGSLRWPGIERTQFIAATNPTGPGAQWVRQLWIEKQFPTHLQSLASEFAFVPGLARDNPHLPESYWQELNTLPDVLRKAWRDGSWYAGVEGIVYPEFTQDNITDEEPNPDGLFELAVDDGHVDPRAILWIQKRGDHVLVCDELYHRRHLPEVCVRETLERSAERKWTKPEIAVGSPEVPELRERFRAADIPYRNGEVKVLPRVTHLRGLFCDGTGHRHIMVNRRCHNLIVELTEGYCYPEGTKSISEKPVDANDHAISALQYWALARCR